MSPKPILVPLYDHRKTQSGQHKAVHSELQHANADLLAAISESDA